MTSSLAMVWACLEQRPGLSGMLQREGVSNSFEMVRGGFPSAVHVAAALTFVFRFRRHILSRDR